MLRALIIASAVMSLTACPGPSEMDGGMGGGGGRAGGSGGSGGTGGSGGGNMGTGGGSGVGGGGTGGGSVMPRFDGGWCDLPGSWVHGDAGYYSVAQLDGGPSPLTWITMPKGFCVHPFARVGNVRQLRFAPGGELFAASPTMGTTSGGASGRSAIVLMPDDDNDGLADSIITWRSNLPGTQGLMFHDGGFWFQDRTRIMKEPYTPGQRAPGATPPQAVVDVQVYVDFGHWPKTIDADEQGTVFVTNGGTQGETCDPARPFRGGVLAIDGSAGGKLIARGLRNPIYLRCHHDGNNHCFANELAKDYSAAQGGREKLIPVREGDDWGYPCCASKDLPYLDECLTCSAATQPLNMSTTFCQGTARCSPKCDTTVAENASFIIGDTPFGLEFIDNQFPPPWDHRVYVAVHGAFGTWAGARVVGISFDPATGMPLPGSNLPGVDAGAMADFLEGWDIPSHAHGRPTDVTVSPDGRLFLANNQNGEIIWIAPIGR